MCPERQRINDLYRYNVFLKYDHCETRSTKIHNPDVGHDIKIYIPYLLTIYMIMCVYLSKSRKWLNELSLNKVFIHSISSIPDNPSLSEIKWSHDMTSSVLEALIEFITNLKSARTMHNKVLIQTSLHQSLIKWCDPQ